MSVGKTNLREQLKRVEEIGVKPYYFEEISALDDYNQREPKITIIYGVKIEDKELEDLIEKALDIIYPEHNYKVSKMVIGGSEYSENANVYVQLEEDVYNQYGSFIGTEKWWLTLTEILRRLEEKKELSLKIKEKIKAFLEKV